MNEKLIAELNELVRTTKFISWYSEYLIGSGKQANVQTLAEAIVEYLDYYS